MPCGSLPKFVEYSISMGLLHLCMNIEARKPELGYFFREQFDPVNRVAKDD